MNQVSLKPNGVLEAANQPVAGHPLGYLGHQLQLADGCTLRTFFFLIDTYAAFAPLSDFLQILKNQYAQCPAGDCCWPAFQWLEYAKIVEMIGYPGNPRLEIYHTLQGIAPEGSQELRQLPLTVLLDMPLRLGKLKHLVFGDRMETFQFETVYSLFEFIDGIAWELSFHGAPSECLTRS